MKRNKKKLTFIAILFCMLVAMGVGYAALQQTLTISGTGNVSGSFDVVIQSIELDTENTNTSSGNVSLMQDSSNIGKSSATAGFFKSILQKPGDYATFNITVENRGTIDAVLSSYTRTATPDNQLSAFLNGASYNTYFTMSNPFDDETKKEIDSGETIVYSIRVDYKENATSMPVGKLEVDISLNYIQKAALNPQQEEPGGNSGVSVPDFTLNSNGVIIGYKESEVTDNEGYVVVGATNSDGDDITGINVNSFNKSNVTVYTETDELSEDEITTYVVEDENNFNAIKGVIDIVTSTTSTTTSGIRVQRLGTAKTRVVRRSEFTGSGVGVKKYVNTSTNQITNPVRSLLKLDLSGASNITSIGEGVLENIGLTYLKLGDSITSIADNAFKNNSLTSITIPASVATIGDYAFADNNFADEEVITIEKNAINSVSRFNSRWTIIGFPGEGPEEEVIPTASNCFTFSKGTISAYNVSCGGTDVVIPSEINGVTVTTIGASAFRDKGITSVFIPYTVTTISNGGSNVGVFTGNPDLETVKFENKSSHPSQLTTIGNWAFRNVSSLTGTLKIPASVTTIGAYAFYNTKFSSIAFENTTTKPSSVTTIGNSAFYGNQITSLTLPNSVTSIGDSAFRSNTYLTEVIFENTSEKPSHLATISASAFRDNTALTGAINLPASVITIGGSAFLGSIITSLTIENTSSKPSLLSTIGSESFRNITTLTGALNLPASLTSIGTYAFGSTKFTSLTIENTQDKPSKLNTLSDNSFRDNKLFTGHLALPASLTSIGAGAFLNAKFTSLTIENTQDKPSHLTTIGNNAFGGDTTLTGSLTIPNTVTSIGSSAFNNAKLTSLTIEDTQAKPSNLSIIKSGAFNNNQIGSLTVPSGIVTIESSAFNNNQIESLTIPASLTTLGQESFYNNNIETLTFELGCSLTKIDRGVFYNNSITDVDIPEGITSIGLSSGTGLYGSFANNALTSVSLPSTLTLIGVYAFYGNQLTGTVVVPSAVTTISANAFYNNSNLSTIVIKRADSTGMTLGSNWKPSTTSVVYDPNYVE